MYRHTLNSFSIIVRKEDDNLIIRSTDVMALHLTLDTEFTIDKVREVFFKSNINLQGIDYAELGLYLAVATSPTL